MMSLATGTNCGPYQILSLLGEGGMGEVYRARDERLGRDVALKVLPESVAHDPGRLRRFEQEARTTGSLNHTNILVIYDIGFHEGSPFIVSELLEGKTIREVLEAAPIPMRKLIDYAHQIAFGLSAAHQKGITHRDLKPENLFLCKDGRVKILDFGLAKLLEPEELGPDDVTKQRAVAGTGAGVILGTVGYMAPEQVRGEPVDTRADIFAFGSVLYEMCSGRRAFLGATPVQTMNAILTDEPPEIDKTNRDVPPALERVIHHCLEKERERRFQSAEDLAFSLAGLGGASSSAVTIGPPQASRPRLAPALLALVAIVLVAMPLIWRAVSQPEPKLADVAPTFKRLTFRNGIGSSALFAPDGQTIVYDASWEGAPVQVFTTRAEGPESRSLGLPPSSGVWSISRQGNLALSIGCQLNWGSCQGTLAEMSLSGGAPRELLEDVDAADWHPDGENLAVVRAIEGIYRVEYPIGNPLFTTAGWINDVAFSPDGALIAFCEHPVIGQAAGNLSVVDLQGERRIVSDGWNVIFDVRWTPDGTEMWFTAGREGNKGEIWAADRSGNTRLVYRSVVEVGVADIAPDGRALIYEIKTGARMVGLTPGRSSEQLHSWFDWSTVADLSADGTTILFYEWGAATDGKPTAYIRSTDGGDAVRLDEGKPLALSPDQSWALAIQGDPPQLVALPTGAGVKKPLDRGGIIDFYTARWFPDGTRVLFTGEGEDRVSRTYVQTIDGGRASQAVEDGILGVLISPDGRRIAGYGYEGGLHLCELPDGGCSPIEGAEPGDRLLQWGEDGSTIYVRGPSNSAIDLFRLDLTSSRRSPWKTIAPIDTGGMVGIDVEAVRLTPDGQYYVYTYWTGLGTLYLATGLK